MNITSIRAEARAFMQEIRGIRVIFTIPIVATILFGLYNQLSSHNLNGFGISANLQIQRTLANFPFPLVFNFLLSFFLLGACFAIISVRRYQKTELSLKDSLQAFDNAIFSKVFVTLFLKKFFLSLWDSLYLIGTATFLYAGFTLQEHAQEVGGQVTFTLPLQQMASLVALSLFGLLISLVGLAISLPQHYAYSQVEYILFEKLQSHSYTSASTILKESRQLMKGYKMDRFKLDLSFIGWYILAGITFGLAYFSLFPYRETSNIIFYERLKQEKVQTSFQPYSKPFTKQL